jgi:PHD/YefM family antitoxin component YafN of YafNO toxin-antitoxin module
VNLMEAKERLHLLVAQVADSGEPIILARPGSLLAVLVSYRRLKAEAYQ